MELKPKDKLIMFAGQAGVIVLLSAFFLTLFGVVDLSYFNATQYPVVIDFIISMILFCGNMYFIFSIALEIFDRSIINILASYLPIYILGEIFFSATTIATFVFPTIYLCLYKIIKKEKVLDFSLNYLIFVCVISVYQIISFVIKQQIFAVSYIETSSVEGLIYSIDLYLVYILIYKGVKNYNGRYFFKRYPSIFKEFLILSKSKSIRQTQSKSNEEINTLDMTKEQKAKFALMVIGYQVFQLITVIGIGIINNMFIEILIMLPIFWIGRKIMITSWHSDKLWICSAVTFASFYVLAKCSLPLEISLFTIIFATILFVYILNKIGIKSDKLKELEQWFDRKEILRKELIELGFSEIKINIALMHCIDLKTIKSIADELGYSEQTCKNYFNEVCKAKPELKRKKSK